MRSTVRVKMASARHAFEKGYTLIEMAIVVSVVGLIMASFISAYSLYMKTRSQQVTENNITLLTSTIGNFLIQKGRYPCPAQMNLTRGDPRYGLESECDPGVTAPVLPNIPYPSPVPAAGTCTAGLCYENGIGLVDVDPAPTNVSPAGFAIPRIRRGAIPFRSLGIPEEQAQDGWGMRFQYAVTENLAVSTTYVARGGGITVYDKDAATAGSLLTPNDNLAHYIIFSSGPDRAGAFSSNGAQITPCGTTGYDDENCNTSVANALAVYSSSDYNPKPGVSHFDDYVQFYSSVETPLWRVQDDAGFHIRDLIKAEATGQVGIGIKSPATNAKVQVSDEVRAQGGNLMADKFCDSGTTGAGCISSSDFASGAPPFQCDPGTYAMAFGDVGGGKYIKCVAASEAVCPKGEVMTGVEFPLGSPNGKPKCSSLAACGALSVTLCSGTSAQTSTIIPADAQANGPWTSPVIGSNYTATYTCTTDMSGTMWNKTSETGSCVCTAIDEYNDEACNSYVGYGNWTGVVTRHHTNICPGNIDTTVISSNTCACSPTSETRLVNCAAGLTGNITQTRDWICTSPSAGYWTAWTNTSNTCTCTPSTINGTQACQSWETGLITRHRDVTCPGPVTSGWIIDSNTCTCFAQTQDIFPACPAGQTGTIVRRRTRDCATNSWGPYIEISNSCACTGATEPGYDACPGPYDTGIITKQRTMNCATSSWGPWSVVSNTCSCVTPAPETRAVTCPSPLLGNIIEARSYNCATGTWGAWAEAQNNCGVVAYFWTAKSSPTGPFGSPLAVQQGGSCSTPGTNSSCSAAAGGGQYWHYSTCQCE